MAAIGGYYDLNDARLSAAQVIQEAAASDADTGVLRSGPPPVLPDAARADLADLLFADISSEITTLYSTWSGPASSSAH